MPTKPAGTINRTALRLPLANRCAHRRTYNLNFMNFFLTSLGAAQGVRVLLLSVLSILAPRIKHEADTWAIAGHTS